MVLWVLQNPNKSTNLGGIWMRRNLLVVSLIVAVMMMPLMVFAAGEQTAQPQMEVLTLDQCLDLAFKNSRDFMKATKNVEKTEEAVRQAEGGFWPTLSYQVGYNKFSDPQGQGWVALPPQNPSQTSPSSWIYSSGRDDGYSGTISLTQPLYSGGKLTDGLKLARLQLEIAKEDQRKAKQALVFNVKSAYYQLWLAGQKLKVTQASYENYGHHYQQVNNFYKVGTASKYDLLQAEVNWKAQKPLLVQAENDLTVARLNLAILLGIDKDRQFTVDVDLDHLQLPEEISLKYQEVLDQAYRDRPEMRQKQYLVESARTSIHISQAGYKPNVSITGQYQGRGSDLSLSSRTWTLTVGLSGVLFDGFTTKAKIDSAKDDLEMATINEASQRDLIQSDIKQAIQTLKAALETTRYNQANINLNKESLRLTEARFNAGMSTTLDVADAQLKLDTALNSYYKSVSDYLTALAKLDLVIGKDS